MLNYSTLGAETGQNVVLDAYLAYRPAVKLEAFDVCPVLLTQPAEGRWTPLHLSEPFL